MIRYRDAATGFLVGEKEALRQLRSKSPTKEIRVEEIIYAHERRKGLQPSLFTDEQLAQPPRTKRRQHELDSLNEYRRRRKGEKRIPPVEKHEPPQRHPSTEAPFDTDDEDEPMQEGEIGEWFYNEATGQWELMGAGGVVIRTSRTVPDEIRRSPNRDDADKPPIEKIISLIPELREWKYNENKQIWELFTPDGRVVQTSRARPAKLKVK